MAEQQIAGKDKDITLKELAQHFRRTIHYLWMKRLWIGLFALLGLILGLSYAVFRTPVYKASISFVTEGGQQGGSALGAYAGLAEKFGLDMGLSGKQETLFSGDNIFELLTTRRMLQNTLFTYVEIEGKRILLINRYLDIYHIRAPLQSTPESSAVRFSSDTAYLTREQSMIVDKICRAIVRKNLSFPENLSRGGKSSIMHVDFTSPDETFSVMFLTQLVDHVAKFYVATKTERARANLAVLNKQLDSVTHALYGAMSNIADFQDQNVNLVRQAPRIAQQKSSLKMNTNSAIYQQLTSAVESAKMDLQRQTPLFEIIDQPVAPLKKQTPSKVIFGLLGLVLFAGMTAGWLLLRRFYHGLMA